MVDLYKLLSTILNRNNISDLYLFANYPPIIREFGEIVFLQMPNLSTPEIKEIAYLLYKKHLKHYEADKETYTQNFTFDFDEKYRLRVHVFNNSDQPNITIHILNKKLNSSIDLCIPEDFHKILKKNSGLVLITGPLNNGKTTTMISILNEIQAKYVLVFDASCELEIKSDRSLINYCNLISELEINFIRKKSPDIIFFHDVDSSKKLIKLAVDCVQDGFLVIASLNSLSVENAVAKIAHSFNYNENLLHVLSEHIIAAMFQVLIKRKDCSSSIAIYDFISFNNSMRNLIKENRIKQLTNSNISHLISSLVEKSILDYESAEKVLIKLGHDGLNIDSPSLNDNVF